MDRESPLGVFGYALLTSSSIFLVADLSRLFGDADGDKAWLMWNVLILLPLAILGLFLIRRDPYVRKTGLWKWKPKVHGLLWNGWWITLGSLGLLDASLGDWLRNSNQDVYGGPDQFGIWFNIVTGLGFVVGLALVGVGMRAYKKHRAVDASVSNF